MKTRENWSMSVGLASPLNGLKAVAVVVCRNGIALWARHVAFTGGVRNKNCQKVYGMVCPHMYKWAIKIEHARTHKPADI